MRAAAMVLEQGEAREQRVRGYSQQFFGSPNDPISAADTQALVALLGDQTNAQREQQVVAHLLGSQEYFDHCC
jgi:hypothetical protein